MAESSAHFIPGSWERIIQDYVTEKFGDPFVVRRRMPLPMDPNYFIGIFHRMGNGRGEMIGQRAPLLHTYDWDAWVMIKHIDEEEGRDKLNDTTTLLWRTLAGANSLVELLAAAPDQIGTGTERYQDHTLISRETFDPVGAKSGGWYHHSRITFTINTEIC